MKHGLTATVVTSEADTEAMQGYNNDYSAEMKPSTARGRRLIERMARASVVMDRAAAQESAAIAHNVRHAIDRFDRERIEQATQLIESLDDNPRGNLRTLRGSPEGVDRLVDAWRDLREDLTADPKPIWTDEQMERAAHLTGYRTRHARSSRVGALSRGFWGDFGGLTGDEGGQPGAARQEWAKAALLELIDAEIAELEAHRSTLDLELIEQDRREAPARALFDTSKAATLARRYERDAERTYFKSLKEFRQVESEFQGRNSPAPAEPPQPPRPPRPPAPAAPKLGSFREEDAEPLTDDERAEFEMLLAKYGINLGTPGEPVTIGRPPRPAG